MAEKDPNAGENTGDGGKDATRLKAESQGWSDKEHWKGNPDDWVDAETFVKRGEEWLTGLKKSNETLARDLNATKQQLKEFKTNPLSSLLL